MSTDIEKLVVTLEANLRKYDRNMEKALRTTNTTARGIERRFGRAGQQVARSFQRMALMAGSSLGAIGIAIGGANFGQLVVDSLAAAEAISDMSRRANVGAEFLQELRFTTSQNGAATRDFDDAISRLNRRLGLFVQTGTSSAKAAFDSLGLTNRILRGELRDTESVFLASVDAMQEVESAAERAAIASQLFGEDSGPRLAQLMNLGTDGIERQRQAARDYGVVMEDELVAKAAAASDALERMGMHFNTEMNTAIAEQADGLQLVAEALTGIATWAVRATSNMATLIQQIDSWDAPVSAAQANRIEATPIQQRLEQLRSSPVGFLEQMFQRRGREIAELEARLAELDAEYERILAEAPPAEEPEGALPPTPSSPPPRDLTGQFETPAAPYGPPERDPIRQFIDQLAADNEAWERLRGRMEEASEGLLDGVNENREQFSRSFARAMTDGAMAMAEGRFPEYFARRVREALANRLYSLFQRLGEMLFNSQQGNSQSWVRRAWDATFGGHKSGGGNMRPGMVYRAGEHGPEDIVLGASAVAVPRVDRPLHAQRSIMVQQVLHLHAENAVMTDELLTEMDMKAAAARQSAVQVSRGDLARMQEQGAMRFGNAY